MPYQLIPPANTAPAWVDTLQEAHDVLDGFPGPDELLGEGPARVFCFEDDDPQTVGVELDPATFLPRPRPA